MAACLVLVGWCKVMLVEVVAMSCVPGSVVLVSVVPEVIFVYVEHEMFSCKTTHVL